VQKLETILKQKLQNAERVAVLGIGSDLRGDDVAGILAAQQIEKTTKTSSRNKICHSERSEESLASSRQTLRAVYSEHSERAQGDNFNKTAPPEVRVFIGETAPENLTGEIKRFQPTHLIIIDSADLDTEPGQIRLLNPEEIGGTSFCTHSLPIKVMVDYLLQSLKFEVITIGIQPGALAIGAKPSKQIIQAAKRLSETIVNLLIAK
jgi:hydrogenase 3 maturation protease